MSQPEIDAWTPLSDEELVRRVRAGERHMFEGLMRRHNQRVFRAARAIVRSDDEAEDVMQEAYVRAFEHLDGFEGRASFSTWILRIAIHEALARVRRGGRFTPLDGAHETEAEVNANERPEGPEEIASSRELARTVEEAVDAMPEAFRVVFMLRAVEQMSVAETAECLEIPEETVKTRLFRARGLIQKAILDRAEGATGQAFAFHLSRCDRVVNKVFARIGGKR